MSQKQNLCPFCLGDNSCRVQADSRCWCFTAAIPEALLRLLPQQTDKSCICPGCIRAYQNDPDAFKAKYPKPQS
ncbi:cysteine-rich CWC family protein [Thalassomonas viridans]|uniref:Cysteine-rich CWC family protein n=1 Tax=Thalassomonas viridans TaxID=137584 RepID=A0AAE9Z326_9GAMM|nr:cysteine-rich CWC family protein [Thalassomonas viridans]WDE04277.1 cysteine-rich CWC family protein [Thalassomonas viridans]